MLVDVRSSLAGEDDGEASTRAAHSVENQATYRRLPASNTVILNGRGFNPASGDYLQKIAKKSGNWLKPCAWLFATFAFFCCKLLLIGRPPLVRFRLALLCRLGESIEPRESGLVSGKLVLHLD